MRQETLPKASRTTGRVLVIGLDALEATLVERHIPDGRFPSLAAFIASASTHLVSSPLDTLPGSVWPELSTGISGARLGHYFTHDQYRVDEARMRPICADDIDPERYYWAIASRAGARVAAIDPVQARLVPALNGIQLIYWGAHDRVMGTQSEPGGLLGEVRARYGDHPVWDSDRYAKSYPGMTRLLRDLKSGIARKTELTLDYLKRERWDLFTCSFSEAHCAGHQFWHFQDPGCDQYDASAPQILKDALLSVYDHLDRAIGRIIEASAADTVIVVTSHGMGPLIGGYQLLPEFLTRLGLSSDRGKARESFIRTWQNHAKHRIPGAWVPFLQKVSEIGFVRRIQASSGGMIFPLQSPATRAAALPNNRVGAIRLNIEGRDPFGCLEPGAKTDAVIREITDALLELRQPESGETIVERVDTADDVFGAPEDGRHPGVPDLLVRFRRDLGTLNRCFSERVGSISIPARNARVPRTGDHTPESRIWISGNDVESGRRGATGSVLDLAPTVLEHLGIEAPEEMDGRPLSAA